ncbi:universal stress protein [Actinosynnema sp. NPDC059797]
MAEALARQPRLHVSGVTRATALADTLIAVGTRGRGALRGMLLGSVSQEAIDRARCPVAVIGADPLEPEDGDATGRAGADREVAVARVEVRGHGSFPAGDPPANR